MSRLKRVVDTAMVAHLWAHQAQDGARNPHGNLYFHGDTIYSYGNHFPVARHVRNKRGERAVLLTTRRYSSTTSGHASVVEGACRHLTAFGVDDPCGGNTKADRLQEFLAYSQQLGELQAKYMRAKTRKPSFLRGMKAVVHQANAFAEFFGIRRRLKLDDAEKLAKDCERIERATAAAAKRAGLEREKRGRATRIHREGNA
jgi:hypothetical protein